MIVAAVVDMRWLLPINTIHYLLPPTVNLVHRPRASPGATRPYVFGTNVMLLGGKPCAGMHPTTYLWQASVAVTTPGSALTPPLFDRRNVHRNVVPNRRLPLSAPAQRCCYLHRSLCTATFMICIVSRGRAEGRGVGAVNEACTGTTSLTVDCL